VCLPQRGWYSPAYAEKEPALSLVFSLNATLPVTITSDFLFLEQ
jgi:hypothetical protein